MAGLDTMKIDPSRSTLPPSSPISPSESPGAFQSLLETGTSARTVAKQRALGFSETGMLGLAHAVGHRSTIADPATPTERLQGVAAEAPGAKGSLPAKPTAMPQARDVRTTADFASPKEGTAHTRPLAFLRAAAAESSTAGPSPSPRPRAVGKQGAPPIHRILHRHRLAEDEALQSSIHLLGKDANITVIFQFHAISEEDCSKIEAVLHDIGERIGVTIRQVVIRRLS